MPSYKEYLRRGREYNARLRTRLVTKDQDAYSQELDDQEQAREVAIYRLTSADFKGPRLEKAEVERALTIVGIDRYPYDGTTQMAWQVRMTFPGCLPIAAYLYLPQGTAWRAKFSSTERQHDKWTMLGDDKHSRSFHSHLSLALAAAANGRRMK